MSPVKEPETPRLEGVSPRGTASQGTAPHGARPAGEPAKGFVDGAAIRVHTGSVLHQDESPLDVVARPPAGKSIDRSAPPASSTKLARLRRRLPAVVSRRLQANVALSTIDRFAHLGQMATYRSWVREFRMRSRSDQVDPYGLDPVFCERWRPLFAFLYRRYWGVQTSGVEHIPDHGRAIIVANHGGVVPYDCVMLMYAIRYDHPAHRTARPLVDNNLFYMPFIGPALNRLGAVRACQDNAERLLGDDHVVVTFPEGDKGTSKTYRERYRLQRFGRGGFVKLALRTGTPIIPAAVLGAEEASPLLAKVAPGGSLPSLPITPTFPALGPLGLLPLPSRWYIRFAPPVALGKHGKQAADDGVLVQRINEQTRSQVQQMLDELLRLRDAQHDR